MLLWYLHVSLFLVIFLILRFDGEKYPSHLDDSIHSHHRECCCVSAGTTHFRHRDEREGEADGLGAASPGGTESSAAIQPLGWRCGPELQQGAPMPQGEGDAKWGGALEMSQFAAGR